MPEIHVCIFLDKESGVILSRKVEDACILLSEYNFRLNAELEERKMVGKMLKDFIACQREHLISAERKLEVRTKDLHCTEIFLQILILNNICSDFVNTEPDKLFNVYPITCF